MDRLGKHLSIFLLVMLAFSILLMIESTKAQFDRVTTYCDISVDDIVEGQPVAVTIQMSPATPTGEGYRVWMWVTPPNPKDFSAGEPWLKNLLTDSNGKATVTFNVLAYSGKWYVDVSFGSNNFANHTILYLAGHWQKEFNVTPIKTPTTSTTAKPTASPIPTANSSPTPTVPEVSWLAILPLLLSIFSAVVVLRHRKTRNQKNNPQQKKRRLQTPRHLKNIGTPTEIHDLFSASLH